jgi:hypothetical protein
MAQQQQNPQQPNRWMNILSQIAMFLIFYYFMFGNKSGQSNSTVDSTGKALPPHQLNLALGTLMDFYYYLSEYEDVVSYDKENLIWHEKGIIFGNWDKINTRLKSAVIPASSHVLNNGSIYLHVFFTSPKKSPNPQDPHYKKPLLTIVHSLVKYLPKSKVYERKNLISGEIDPKFIERKKLEAEQNIPNEKRIVNYWKGNFTLNLIQDSTAFPAGGIPEPIKRHMVFDMSGNYYPILFRNDFWLLDEELVEINSTVKEFKLDLTFEPMSFFKFALLVQMDDSFVKQKEMMGSGADYDDIKRILLDNSPYILALTFLISIVHTLLDVLAFKNEIQFWRNRKSLEGQSVRTIYINLVCNVIVLLYILDHEETSWIIIINCILGVAIEAWKITKTAKITIQYWQNIPYPVFADKESYTRATREHDLKAMKYLYYVLYLLVICYAIYSLLYENHKSWYSWIVGSLAGCVYTFGFIMMTPQLFINYKLKSVAHLPWRTFVYKAINTFIDDLFAFLIRMPTLHRLRVFRDDIVFIIYIYQRWIYPTDKNRIEVGGEFEDVNIEDIRKAQEEEELKKKKETNVEPTKEEELPKKEKED